MLYSIVRGFFRIILQLFFGLHVEGRDLLPKHGPFIVASNHVSNLDPIIVGAGCPPRLCFLGKEQLFRNKLFGAALRGVDVIPLKRTKSDVFALKKAIRLLQKGKAVGIFPQGGRSESFDRARSGVGFLFQKVNCPIIAARVFGSDIALPKGSNRLRLNKIRIVFAPVEGIDRSEERGVIAKKVLDTIKSLV